MNNHQAFEGLSEGYDNYRAKYPQILVEQFSDLVDKQFPHLLESGVIADIGSGTGISTRQLADTFSNAVRIIGIEPGDDMYERFQTRRPLRSNIDVLKGSGEKIPLESNFAKGIFVAQAIQWFDRDQFYIESIRVLCSNGVLGIIQNNRDWMNSAFFNEYEFLLESHSPGYSRNYRTFNIEKELNSAGFNSICSKVTTNWNMSISPKELLSWSLTSSKAKRACEAIGRELFISHLNNIIKKHIDYRFDFNIPYISELYLIINANEYKV